jgi:UDP-N-acetylglucosamine:LPS N-acetylglucosamine transferase
MREILIYEKPAILIPYPNAKDDHQTDNAKYIEEVVKGGVCLRESHITSDFLVQKIFLMERELETMKILIQEYKQRKNRVCFSEVL